VFEHHQLMNKNSNKIGIFVFFACKQNDTIWKYFNVSVVVNSYNHS